MIVKKKRDPAWEILLVWAHVEALSRNGHPTGESGFNSLDRIRRGKLALDYQRSPVYLRFSFLRCQ